MHLPQNAVPSLWNLLFARNPFFIGQEEWLSRLHSQYLSTSSNRFPPVQAITGLGGMGKTQLALEYAYRFRQDYQAVFWVQAESQETLYASYAELAQMLNLPESKDLKQERVVQAVKTWLQAHEHWLLILDNADEPELCLPFLPSLLRGHVLLTTRATALRRLGITHVLTLESFPAAMAALLLLRRAGRLAPFAPLEEAPVQDQTLALQLVQELGSLPLALDQAGAYLEATGMNLDSYWQIYQQYASSLFAEHYGQQQYHPEPVATTWQLAFQRVQARNPAAAALLHLCAFLHPEAIDDALLAQGGEVLGPVLSSVVINRYLFEKALETLRAYSLVTRDAQHQTLSLHRLVQSVIRASLPLEEQQLWMQRIISLLARAFPTTIEVTNWVRCERLLPHVLLAVKWCEQDPSLATAELAYVLNQGGYFLTRRARLKEAQPLLQQALSIREQVLDPLHPDIATCLHNLGVLYDIQGKYEQAEQLLQRALAIREQVLGSLHPYTAITLSNLGMFYFRQRKYEQAESFQQGSLTILEQVLDPLHPDLAASLNDLGFLYRAQGKYEQAEPLIERALAIREKVLGPLHSNTAISLNNLAGLYREQGKYKQAEPLMQRALAIREQVLGPEHRKTATSLTSLALLYREQGKYEQAEPLMQRALAIREQVLGAEHPETLRTLSQLGRLYSEQKRYEQAESLLEQVLSIQKRFLGSEHPETLQSLGYLGRLYSEQRRDAQAESLLEQVLNVQERLLGIEHPALRDPLSSLAMLYQSQQRRKDAARVYERLLVIQERVLGETHPDTQVTRSHLTSLGEASRAPANPSEEG